MEHFYKMSQSPDENDALKKCCTGEKACREFGKDQDFIQMVEYWIMEGCR